MISNDDMRAGRWAKLAKGRRIMRRMNACWDAGGFVRIGTATRYSDFKPQHRSRITMDKTGSLYMSLRSTRRDCIDYCSFQFSA